MREPVRLFPYFGTKARLAPLYPSSNGVVVEPFAGAAAYSCRFYDHQIWLFEKNPIVFGVLDYLIRTPPLEILKLPLVKDEAVSSLNIPQEAKWLIGFWLNRGTTKPADRRSKGWGSCPSAASVHWGINVRERVAWSVGKIKHWKVFNKSFEESSFLDSLSPTWFIDPPYQQQGKSYVDGSQSINFSQLGNWCAARRGRVIVCENIGADWLPFKPFRMEIGQRIKHNQMEVVWYKGVPKTGFGLV